MVYVLWGMLFAPYDEINPDKNYEDENCQMEKF